MAGRFSALRHRDFRLYWVGFVVAVSGQQMQWMIEGWLIYQLSGSKLLLGLNGAAQFIPSTALTLFGGALADKFDQRRLLIGVQLLFIAVLAALSALGVLGLLTAWHVIAGGFVLSAIGSFEGPARQAMFPHLVNREAMPSAVALNAMIHPATRVGAPVVGGLVSAFVFDFAGLGERRGRGGVRDNGGGGGCVRGDAVEGASAAGGPFARTERAGGHGRGAGVHPAGAGVRVPHRDGVLQHGVRRIAGGAVPGVRQGRAGRWAGGTGVHVGRDGRRERRGSVHRVEHDGAASAACAADWRSGGTMGVFMAAFAFSEWYWVSLGLLFALGTGASMLNVGVQTNLQMLVANEFRGRVMGVWSMMHTSVRPMGELQFAGVAAVVSAPFAVVGRRGCGARVRAGVQLAQQAVGAPWGPARGRAVKGELV